MRKVKKFVGGALIYLARIVFNLSIIMLKAGKRIKRKKKVRRVQ